MMETYFWTSFTLVMIVQLGKFIKNSPVMFIKLITWLFPLLLIQLFIVNIFCFLSLDSKFIDTFMFIQFIFYFFAILGIYSEFKGILGRAISVPSSFLTVNIANLQTAYLVLAKGFSATRETKIY